MIKFLISWVNQLNKLGKQWSQEQKLIFLGSSNLEQIDINIWTLITKSLDDLKISKNFAKIALTKIMLIPKNNDLVL
ncbi:hypothetical protein MG1601_19 [Mycoplasmoides gallisepticum]